MKAIFNSGGVTFVREDGDPKFYGHLEAKGEHTLFRHIARFLNRHGFDVIKKRAHKDGHLVDEFQPYIRTLKPGTGTPDIYIISPFYAIRGANEDWNEGAVDLALYTDVFEKGQDTPALIRELCEKHPDLEFTG